MIKLIKFLLVNTYLLFDNSKYSPVKGRRRFNYFKGNYTKVNLLYVPKFLWEYYKIKRTNINLFPHVTESDKINLYREKSTLDAISNYDEELLKKTFIVER